MPLSLRFQKNIAQERNPLYDRYMSLKTRAENMPQSLKQEEIEEFNQLSAKFDRKPDSPGVIRRKGIFRKALEFLGIESEE